jgi:hypothetical protein
MPEQTNIKRYKVKDTWKDHEVTLEVNHTVLTQERARMIITSWSDDEQRLEEENGDVIRTVIRLFGLRMINALLAEEGGCFGSNCESTFSDDHPGAFWTRELHNENGWGGSIDGEPYGWCGIRLIAADVESATFDSVELVEVPNA